MNLQPKFSQYPLPWIPDFRLHGDMLSMMLLRRPFSRRHACHGAIELLVIWNLGLWLIHIRKSQAEIELCSSNFFVDTATWTVSSLPPGTYHDRNLEFSFSGLNLSRFISRSLSCSILKTVDEYTHGAEGNDFVRVHCQSQKRKTAIPCHLKSS